MSLSNEGNVEQKKLTAIGVKGLFGLYDHHVNLNDDQRVTILHGPNGVGKTVFLKMIKDFIIGELQFFPAIEFDCFYIISAAGKEYRLNRRKNEIVFVDNETEYPVHEESVRTPGRFFTQPRPVSDRFYQWAEEIMTSVYMIGVDRLAAYSEGNMGTVQRAPDAGIGECASHLRNHIIDGLTLYAQRAQQLDQSFPKRFLVAGTAEVELETLRSKFQGLTKERQRLRKLSLLDELEDDSPFDIEQFDTLDHSQKAVMALYIRDAIEKLGTLKSLADKIELFLLKLNNKLQNKQLSIDAEFGLNICDVHARNIPLYSLSSGEQHQLILFYNLLFKTNIDSLVLVDEPELSLHISWQKSFVDDLLAIQKIVPLDIVLATHSPYIVEGHSDLMVPLSAKPVEQQAAA